MTNPAINVVLQKMDEIQKEFFKLQEQVMDNDTDYKYTNPELYAKIGSMFGRGYETMANAVANLALNDIKTKTRLT